MVGHAFVFNYNCSKLSKTGFTPYESMFGETKFKLFILGELVFFIPAPTILSCKVAKVESNLRAGIFLDYYVGSSGLFTGQYICVVLEDFVGKNLHRAVARQHFRLRLHRTEVLKRPVGVSQPLFPLVKKYNRSNFTVEGLEAKDSEVDISPTDVPR